MTDLPYYLEIKFVVINYFNTSDVRYDMFWLFAAVKKIRLAKPTQLPTTQNGDSGEVTWPHILMKIISISRKFCFLCSMPQISANHYLNIENKNYWNRISSHFLIALSDWSESLSQCFGHFVFPLIRPDLSIFVPWIFVLNLRVQHTSFPTIYTCSWAPYI